MNHQVLIRVIVELNWMLLKHYILKLELLLMVLLVLLYLMETICLVNKGLILVGKYLLNIKILIQLLLQEAYLLQIYYLILELELDIWLQEKLNLEMMEVLT
nr:MAG TPA: hypothetical protein [Bacteriophage sp.]